MSPASTSGRCANPLRTRNILCAKAAGIGLCDSTEWLCGNCAQLAPGKVCLSAKIHTLPDADSEDVLRDALSYAKYKYGLAHSTIQVTSDETLL